MQVAIYNSVSLLLDTAVTVWGKLCHIIVKLPVTLTLATAKASVETLGQDERQITFAPHSLTVDDHYRLAGHQNSALPTRPIAQRPASIICKSQISVYVEKKKTPSFLSGRSGWDQEVKS